MVTSVPASSSTANLDIHTDIEKVLFTTAVIASRTSELGAQLAADYADKAPLVVSTLKGSVIFFADLVRHMCPVPDGLQLEFIRAKSYHGGATETSGDVEVSMSTLTAEDVAGRHVLLVEDIVDTGLTAQTLVGFFEEMGAASVEMCALLSKPSRRAVDGYEPKYVGFEVEDAFVVGMGLDYREKYRSLGYIGVLKKELYA